MDERRNVHLKRLHGRLGEVVYHMTKVQFTQFTSPETWQPAVNAYSCEECIVICVDLAGVDRESIQLEVHGRQLLLRGNRQPPEPEGPRHKALQVLVMEIDYGPFSREVRLPADVDADRITAEQRNGLLWIYLPFRSHA